MSCPVLRASCGGCTHFITTKEASGVMTIGFGQGVVSPHSFTRVSLMPSSCMAVGADPDHDSSEAYVSVPELGLGADSGKSASKPQQIMPLADIDVIE